VLGRDVHGEQEKIAWSIVVATKGIKGFVDALLNSEEYLSAFGFDTVPYQRRRVLHSRVEGETPFNIKSPRYDAYYRGILGFPQIIWQNEVRTFIPQDKQAKAGDPSQFLNMAVAISPQANPVPRVSAQNMDYQALVPRRR
jgi:phycobilisome rod-core linker protein